jgi:hypothetical protein
MNLVILCGLLLVLLLGYLELIKRLGKNIEHFLDVDFIYFHRFVDSQNHEEVYPVIIPILCQSLKLSLKHCYKV